MPNSHLDWRKLLCSTRRSEISQRGRDGEAPPARPDICAEEIEHDYDRILSANPTRRLADKTQLFSPDVHASISTRFSHSLEVSNLARGVGIRLAHDHRDEVFGDDAVELKVERTVPALLATVGLAHDLGTPPFGHPGEEAIALWYQKRNIKLQDFSKFNSNCQTFRLLTRLETTNDNSGLDLTYATLAALLKYPVFSNDLRGLNKFGIFERERKIALEVWDQTGLAEGVRHPLAYIVEACDDIAYSVMDVEDIVRAKQCEKRIRETMDYIWCGIVNWDSDSVCSCSSDHTYLSLPKNCRRVYEGTNRSGTDKLHLLCDVVAGMADGELTSLHDNLKNSHGSRWS